MGGAACCGAGAAGAGGTAGIRTWGAQAGTSTAAGHCVAWSDEAGAAGAEMFGAHDGATGFAGSGPPSG